ncbi:zinc-binding dehydrogenase [Cupriavidus pinatubonensis]|uniref:zinc-binding dehydrogenase n=1 Tax=Cupriavidus pinatubonensis TaxID=248026 RepID=UPI002159F4B8|nr:zinc-binding dehydrogenase [Cupriavidus pinatubonensis]
MRPALFRHDLIALLDLLQQKKIKTLIAARFSLAEARQAHELLGEPSVTGKIVLVPKGVERLRTSMMAAAAGGHINYRGDTRCFAESKTTNPLCP